MRGIGLIILAALIATPAAARSGRHPMTMDKATPPETANVVVETGATVPLPRARPPAPAKTAETAAPPKPPVPPGPPTFQETAALLGLDPASVTSKPTLCDERLETMAKIRLEPRLIGPGACGGADLVQVTDVVLPDKSKVRLHPAPMLQCRMAESLAAWLRDEVAPRIAKLGSPLREVENWDGYECRSRNRIAGAKLSEHAKGDAIDLRSFQLADGKTITLTDPRVNVALREGLRDSACSRFTTVLGPGAPYHGQHIHLDAIQRHNGYRICHWDVREPPPVPLPRPRPAAVARAAPAKTANTVVAMVPAGAGKATSGAAEHKATEPKATEPAVLHIKPRPSRAASPPEPAAEADGGAQVPLPVPKPASLTTASPAPRVHRVRHRKHHHRRRTRFPFPFFPWR